MIRLLLIINSILLTNSLEASWFGKYNSRLDARSACESWQSKGFLYKYDVMKDVGYLERTFINEGKRLTNELKSFKYIEKWETETKKSLSRYCREENITRQYIGTICSGIKKKHYSASEWEMVKNKIKCERKKYFKY